MRADKVFVIVLLTFLCSVYKICGHDDDANCGFDEYIEELFSLHPEYKTHMELIEPQIHTAVTNILESGRHPFLKTYNSDGGGGGGSRRLIDTSEPQVNIRVYFHIFYAENRPEDNVDDDTLRDAMDKINRAFSGEFDDNVAEIWQDRVGSAKINFFSDIPNDVNRVVKEDDWVWDVSGSRLVAEEELKLSSEGGSDGVDMDTTMNVWVAPTDNGPTGYSASIPLLEGCFEFSENEFGFEGWRDGIFLRPNLLGGEDVDRRGTSFPHEAGHYLGLWHPFRPWGQCTDGDAGDEPGDGVDDTPVLRFDTGSCACDTEDHVVPEENTIDSCPDENNERDMWENIMDYCSECRFMFTEGQATLARVVLENCRPDLYAAGVVQPDTLDPWSFVIDVSPSMQNDIDAVVDTSIELLDLLVDENKNPEYYILTLFQNPPSIEPTAITHFVTMDFDSSDDFVDAVRNIATEPGDVCDESSFSGINSAVDTATGVRGSTRGNIFVFTDANKHDDDLEPSDILPKLIGGGNNFRVNFILSYDANCVGDNVDQVYSEVASTTNGFIIPTANDAILESVEIIKDFLIYLDQIPIVQIETDSDTLMEPFDVDPGITDLIIVISGDFNSNPMYTSFTDEGGFPVSDTYSINTVDGSGFQKVIVTLNPQLISTETWTISVSFDNSRRRMAASKKRLLNTRTNKLNIYSGDPTISVDVTVANIDNNYNVISTSNGFLYYDEDGSFVIYVSSGGSDEIITISEISVLSTDYSNSATKNGNDVYYDAINKVYYSLFDFSELDSVIDVTNNVFRVRTIGTDSNNNRFTRISTVATHITDINIIINCDDALFFVGFETSCIIELERNDASTDEEYTLTASIDNSILTSSNYVTFSCETNPILFVTGQFEASTVLNIIISSNEAILGETFSLTVGVTNFDGSINYDVVGIITIERDWCPQPCNTNPCDCNEVENCNICHPNGCSQCHGGYFKKNWDYSCESCSDTFGDNCIFCQDFNGCGQCKSGSVRTYDARCRLWYCNDGTDSSHDGSRNPGVIINVNSNDCPIEQYKCSNDGTPCDCNQVTNCDVCNPGATNGCSQCESGYFKEDSDYNCAPCQEIFGNKCMFCQDYNGCGQCVSGCNRVYDSHCGVYVCNC